MTDIIKELLKHPDIRETSWDEPYLRMWAEAGFQCVYCKRDMLESYIIAHGFSCKDHILPKKKYSQFENKDWNHALSCRPCNGIKLAFDPNSSGLYVPGPSDKPKLIKAAKDYIDLKRKDPTRKWGEDHFEKERAVILEALAKRNE